MIWGNLGVLANLGGKAVALTHLEMGNLAVEKILDFYKELLAVTCFHDFAQTTSCHWDYEKSTYLPYVSLVSLLMICFPACLCPVSHLTASTYLRSITQSHLTINCISSKCQVLGRY